MFAERTRTPRPRIQAEPGFNVKGTAKSGKKHDPGRKACEVKQAAEDLIAEIAERISTPERMREALKGS